ncbi:MAG: YraN family protein [Chromatiales bacterium]|nr:YraN family protein [Chromatiales bacterium]
MTGRQARGAHAEALARAHLEHAGLKLVERNYRCPRGEIDLIMADGDTLVFVEVRFRRSPAFGSAAESVDARKRTRIIAAARHYLLAHPADRPCRFDVVAADGSAPIAWLRDAFRLD